MHCRFDSRIQHSLCKGRRLNQRHATLTLDFRQRDHDQAWGVYPVMNSLSKNLFFPIIE
jgi:hypothetical protein